LFWANNLPKIRGAAMHFSAAEEDKHTRHRSEASGKTPAHAARSAFAKRSIFPALFCLGCITQNIRRPPEIVLNRSWSARAAVDINVVVYRLRRYFAFVD
jgi:hypothetical protein